MLFINISGDSVISHILVKRFVFSRLVLLSIGEYLSILVSGLHRLVRLGLESPVVMPCFYCSTANVVNYIIYVVRVANGLITVHAVNVTTAQSKYEHVKNAVLINSLDIGII